MSAGRALPAGWDSVPDSDWPEIFLSAVRTDPSALASPRAIATIRAWQASARDEFRAPDRQLARRRLEALGRAIAGEPATDDLLAAFDFPPPAAPSASRRPLSEAPPPLPPEASAAAGSDLETALPALADLTPPPAEDVESGTIDAFQLPPKPNLRRGLEPRVTSRPAPKARRVSLPPAEEEGDTDARVAAIHGTTTGASLPPEDAFGEDENPTTAFAIPEDRVPPPPPPPPPLPPEARAAPPRDPTPVMRAESALAPVATPGQAFVFEEDDKPTRHIALPEEVLLRRLDSAQAALEAEVEAEEADDEPERTQMAPYPPKPPSVRPRGPTPKVEIRPVSMRDEPEEEPSRLAPKPGIIRRSVQPARGPSAARPRAAMHHVRALHTLLHGFVEELVPLPYERRSRRFWARWREVAGDRGVRREFVESLLASEDDARNLLCELIAEVQAVDPASVRTLVDKLDKEEAPAVLAQPVESGGQPRGPLLGASVRVDPEDG